MAVVQGTANLSASATLSAAGSVLIGKVNMHDLALTVPGLDGVAIRAGNFVNCEVSTPELAAVEVRVIG